MVPSCRRRGSGFGSPTIRATGLSALVITICAPWIVRVIYGDAFAQSAIAAEKQWRYAPIGFEGLLTVNVNFTLPG